MNLVYCITLILGYISRHCIYCDCDAGKVRLSFSDRVGPGLVNLNYSSSSDANIESFLGDQGLWSEVYVAYSYQLTNDVYVIAFKKGDVDHSQSAIVIRESGVTYRVNNPSEINAQFGTFFWHNGSVFFCGLASPTANDTECQMFDKASLSFSIVPSLSQGLDRIAPAVLAIGNKTCMFGGFDFASLPTLCLNVSGMTWDVDNSLPQVQQSEHRMIIHDSVLYSCGGSKDLRSYEFCDKFDLSTDTGTGMRSMQPIGFPYIENRAFDLFIEFNRLVATGIVITDSKQDVYGTPTRFDVETGQVFETIPGEFVTLVYISICDSVTDGGISFSISSFLCLLCVLIHRTETLLIH